MISNSLLSLRFFVASVVPSGGISIHIIVAKVIEQSKDIKAFYSNLSFHTLPRSEPLHILFFSIPFSFQKRYTLNSSRSGRHATGTEVQRTRMQAEFVFSWVSSFVLQLVTTLHTGARVSFGRTGERGIIVFCFEGEVILTTNSVTTCSIPQRLSSA